MSNAGAKTENAPSGDLLVGDWRVDPRRNELRQAGRSVRLEPKAVEVLMHLAGRPGEVVSREELLAAVWPGVVVGDDALTQAIIKLRKALDDDAHRPKHIETISKRGYRLIAQVGRAGTRAAAASAPRRHLLLAAVGGAVVVLAVVVFSLSGIGRQPAMPWPVAGEGRPPALASLPTVAVLPLSNLSGDAKRDYFSDGMTEDIISALGRFAGLRVMSANAVQAYKGKAPAPRTIRDELGARYIVQGSVRAADGRLRIAVELSDAEGGAQLWSERYEGADAEVFEIQDRIVKRIVGMLHVKLTQFEQQRAFTKPTESLEAYDLVLKARALLGGTDRTGNREARALLARAGKIAPGYAEVNTVLANAEWQRVNYGWIEDAAEGLRRAEAHARHALTSPDERAHAGAHALLAGMMASFGRHEEALTHSERAIALNPSDATSLFQRGITLLWTGRIPEAVVLMETAKRYEPNPAVGLGSMLVIAYYLSGRHRDALVETDALLARSPRHGFLHAMRAAALSELGNAEEASRAVQAVRSLSPSFRVEDFGTRFADPRYAEVLRDGLRKAGL